MALSRQLRQKHLSSGHRGRKRERVHTPAWSQTSRYNDVNCVRLIQCGARLRCIDTMRNLNTMKRTGIARLLPVFFVIIIRFVIIISTQWKTTRLFPAIRPEYILEIVNTLHSMCVCVCDISKNLFSIFILYPYLIIIELRQFHIDTWKKEKIKRNKTVCKGQSWRKTLR